MSRHVMLNHTCVFNTPRARKPAPRKTTITPLPRASNKALIIVAVLGVAGSLLMLLATRFGVGIDPDSTVYLDAGRSLLRGMGMVVLSGRSGELIPLTHYPPLYPALLALIGKSGLSLESAARVVNAVLFGSNATLVGLIISLYARDSLWLPVLGSLLTLTAVDVAASHSIALTEPLFIFFTLLGLMSLALYLENQQRRFLIAAALAMACSLLTRYVGIVSVITGALVLTSLHHSGPGTAAILPAAAVERSTTIGRAPRSRLVGLLLFAAVAFLPMILWVIRNYLLVNAPTDRQIVFHPVRLQHLVSALSTVAQWLLLGKVSGRIRVIGFLIEVVILICLTLYWWSKGREHAVNRSETLAPWLPRLLGFFIIAYVAFLIFTASFIDADTVFDSRSLLPVHVVGIVLVLYLTRDLQLRAGELRFARIAVVLFAVLLVASHSFRFVAWLERSSKDGQGYASRSWIYSETIAAVKSTAPGVPIYSNGYDAIYYLTGRRAILIPEKIVHGTGRPNPNYEKEVETMVDDIMDHDGVLVYFHKLPERSYLPSEEELRERVHLQVFALNDGSILKQ